MDTETLEEKLNESGEIHIKVAEIDSPIELHLYDTKFDHDTNKITHLLTDGDITIDAGEVVGHWVHFSSLTDYGLE